MLKRNALISLFFFLANCASTQTNVKVPENEGRVDTRDRETPVESTESTPVIAPEATTSSAKTEDMTPERLDRGAKPPATEPAAPTRSKRSSKSEAGSGGGGAVSKMADESSLDAPSGRRSESFESVRDVAAAPAMQAGRHDDNKEYNRFVSFLQQHIGFAYFRPQIAERLLIQVTDRDGKSIPNCFVDVQTLSGASLTRLTSYADGMVQFFPTEFPEKETQYALQATCGDQIRKGQLARGGKRTTIIAMPSARKIPQRVPVDIAFAFDTTGSMGGQIERLKKTLKAIHFQLSQLETQPDIRFGLVAYRDQGDDYITRVTGFTNNIDQFQAVIDKLDADGGGDTPEDLQSALEKSMHELSWRTDALRLGFIVADAPPHTDYNQKFHYGEAMKESARRGIKWTSVGVGGLATDGEVIFRQIAQYTMGEYVFVTESGGGDTAGSSVEASHHVGTNYKVENLDQAIVRIVKRELSYLTDRPKDFDDTIVVSGTSNVPRDQTLAPAAAEVMRQLHDYSALALHERTPVAIVPVQVSDAKYKDTGEYLTDQMTLVASRNPGFKVVERDLQALSKEIKLQLSDLFDVKDSVPIGKMIGAEVLIVAKLRIQDQRAELFAKLIRVETGEVLSIARADIEKTVLKGS